MGKRGFIFVFLIVFLALIPFFSYASGDLIFSDTVEDRDTVVIEGIDFEFRIDRNGKALIEVDNSGIIIPNGECKTKFKFNICVNNISFSYRNLTIYYDVYKALVDVYQSKSNLDVDISLDKENLLVDEEVNGELLLENSADIASESVKATLNFPSNLLLTSVEKCKLSGNSIIFDNKVNARQIKDCPFTVKALSPGDFELGTEASFFDGIAYSTATSNKVEGEVYNSSLRINYDSNISSFNLKEKFDFAIVAENTNPEYDLTVTTLNIKVPDKLFIFKRPKDLSGTGKILSWSGVLESGESKSFSLGLQGLKTGKYEIIISTSYKVGRFLRQVEEVFDLNVECDCPSIEHEFSQKIVVPEQRAVLRAILINKGKGKFKNVKIDYVTNVPGIEDFSTAYGSIRPGEVIDIFDRSVISPAVGTYYLNITVVYESSANEVFVIDHDVPIGVEIEEIEEVKEEDVEQEGVEKPLVEEQKEENISVAIEETNDEVVEEEEKKNESQQDVIATTLEDQKNIPIKAYAMMGFIVGLVFIVVVLVILKKRRGNRPLKPGDQTSFSKLNLGAIERELKKLQKDDEKNVEKDDEKEIKSLGK